MTFYYNDTYGEHLLKLQFSTYEFDISDQGDASSARRLDLTTWSDSNWSELTVKGDVTVPDDIWEVFPEEKRESPPAELILAIDCPDTHTRKGEVLEDNPIESGSFSFEITCERSLSYGTVLMTPFVVLTDDIGLRTTDYATFQGQRVADGRRGRVLLDDLGQDRGGLMNVEFKPFSDTAIPNDNIYHLHRSTGDFPEVWVNEDHKLISDVLDSGGHSGFRPYLRKTLGPWIAMDVKIQMIEWAITGAEGGDFDEPWQERILDEYGPSLYDRTHADEPQELYQLYQGEFGDDPHFLLNQIEIIVQQDSDIASPLTTFIEKEGPDYLSYEEAE